MSQPTTSPTFRSLLALLGVLVVALALLLVAGNHATSEAAPDGKVDIVYLFVTGEGPSAKAWFKDAPSTGLAVQDALDRFAKQGYHAKLITDELRSTADAVAFVILLERSH
ncbi:MAG: hypothetical protein QNJ90_16140 [Planctomycetota bacterium]|nr:hypothetical protein [Planctomycetota bacterium]